MIPNTSFLATVVTLPSAGVAMLARLTIADPSCSNKHSMERVGKVKNANKGKKCNTTCVLIPLSEINTKHQKRTHNSLTRRLFVLINSLLQSRHTSFTNDPFVSDCAGQIMQSRKN